MFLVIIFTCSMLKVNFPVNVKIAISALRQLAQDVLSVISFRDICCRIMMISWLYLTAGAWRNSSAVGRLFRIDARGGSGKCMVLLWADGKCESFTYQHWLSLYQILLMEGSKLSPTSCGIHKHFTKLKPSEETEWAPGSEHGFFL